jgi:hypothetical protein
MDEGLHVPRVELERSLQFAECPLRLTQQRKRHSQKVMNVGEGSPRVDYRLEQVDGAIVVLHHEPLPGAC